MAGEPVLDPAAASVRPGSFSSSTSSPKAIIQSSRSSSSSRGRGPARSRGGRNGLHVLERVDAHAAERPRLEAVRVGPEPRERVHLRPRAGHAGQLVLDRCRELREGGLVPRRGEDQVVRRRPDRGRDRLAALDDDPETLLG